MRKHTYQPKPPCPECGAPVLRPGARTKFCTTDCATTWQQRRCLRGAYLYDLWMTNRHQRAYAKALKVLHVMTRLAMYWYEEDKQRRTWNNAQKAIEANSWAKATVVFRKR